MGDVESKKQSTTDGNREPNPENQSKSPSLSRVSQPSEKLVQPIKTPHQSEKHDIVENITAQTESTFNANSHFNQSSTMLMREKYVTNNGLIVTCYIGDVIQAEAEGIVTGENSGMSGPSMITKAICERGKIEYSAMRTCVTDKYGEVKGGVFCLDTEKCKMQLQFKVIILAIVLQFKGGNAKDWKSQMTLTYTKILNEADKNGVTSLAMPLLGSGGAEAPLDVAAEALLESVSQYSGRCLIRVLLVSIDFSVYDELVKQCQNYFCLPSIDSEGHTNKSVQESLEADSEGHTNKPVLEILNADSEGHTNKSVLEIVKADSEDHTNIGLSVMEIVEADIPEKESRTIASHMAGQTCREWLKEDSVNCEFSLPDFDDDVLLKQSELSSDNHDDNLDNQLQLTLEKKCKPVEMFDNTPDDLLHLFDIEADCSFKIQENLVKDVLPITDTKLKPDSTIHTSAQSSSNLVPKSEVFTLQKQLAQDAVKAKKSRPALNKTKKLELPSQTNKGVTSTPAKSSELKPASTKDEEKTPGFYLNMTRKYNNSLNQDEANQGDKKYVAASKRSTRSRLGVLTEVNSSSRELKLKDSVDIEHEGSGKLQNMTDCRRDFFDLLPKSSTSRFCPSKDLNHEHVAQYSLQNGVVVLVHLQDILKVQAEVIVTGESTDLSTDLNKMGLVTQLLYKQIGVQFGEWRNELVQTNQKLKVGQVYEMRMMSTLPFRYCFSAIMYAYHGQLGEDTQWVTCMERIYSNIVQKAEEVDARSVVMPLLGSGRAGAPVQLAIRVALETLSRQAMHHMQTIHIALVDRTIFKQVQEECENMNIHEMPPSAPRNAWYSDSRGSTLESVRTNVRSGERDKQHRTSELKASAMPEQRHEQTSRKYEELFQFKDRERKQGRSLSTSEFIQEKERPQKLATRASLSGELLEGARKKQQDERIFESLDRPQGNEERGHRHSSFAQEAAQFREPFGMRRASERNIVRSGYQKEAPFRKPFGMRGTSERYIVRSPYMEEAPFKKTFGMRYASERNLGRSGYQEAGRYVEENLDTTVTSRPTDVTKAKVWTADAADICVICIDCVTNPKRLPKCGHVFCTACIDKCFKVFKPVCPICNAIYGVIIGTQPAGTMTYKHQLDRSLPGHPHCGTITIKYHFNNGIQGSEHPNPGSQYYGTTRIAFLPDSEHGKKVLRLLQLAFKRRVTFAIGMSLTTGKEDVITWNDIHHKTRTGEDRKGFGYPDPEYLSRVMEELACKGITEADL